MSHASHLVWDAARLASGWPEDDVRDSLGRPIPPQKGPPGICAACGAPAHWKLSDAISDPYSTVSNNRRAWAHGGDRICAACLFVARSIPLRASLWFAAPGRGVYFVPTRPLPGLGGADSPWRRPDPLAQLLCPPEPPFVAGWGWMGIDKGGESHIARAWWPGAVCPRDATPLSKLQAKHVGVYARIAHDARCYPLQVDDAEPIFVDVARWSRLRTQVEELATDLRAAGVGANDLREALTTGRPPPRTPLRMLAEWPRRSAFFAAHAGAPWWRLFVDIFPIPELTKKEKR
jgi:hypothetical protein